MGSIWLDFEGGNTTQPAGRLEDNTARVDPLDNLKKYIVHNLHGQVWLHHRSRHQFKQAFQIIEQQRINMSPFNVKGVRKPSYKDCSTYIHTWFEITTTKNKPTKSVINSVHPI